MIEVCYLQQIAKLMNVSICVYHEKSEEITPCHPVGWQKLSKEQADLLGETFHFWKADHPVIDTLGKNLITGEIWNPKCPDEWILFGPVSLDTIDAEWLKHKCKRDRELTQIGLSYTACSLDIFVSGILLVFGLVAGKTLSEKQFWEKNEAKLEKIKRMEVTLARDIFSRQENYTLHNPYEQERRELEAIRQGDIKALEQSLKEDYDGKIGILAKDVLRHHKNVAIGNITLASRAAISGGMSVEKSFSMADSFSQQVEELGSVLEVEMFKRRMKYIYAQTVSDEREDEGSEDKNPLIAGVKDYIFSHLHGAIQISDIAKSLHVNADYLSHLFRKSEHITIKRYILKEKIRRAQNLLRYSDYRIQDIAFYLGFSSQSHFTKIFSEITGMNPNEYRKQFNDREKWDTI